jgi:hypothetical protein
MSSVSILKQFVSREARSCIEKQVIPRVFFLFQFVTNGKREKDNTKNEDKNKSLKFAVFFISNCTYNIFI